MKKHNDYDDDDEAKAEDMVRRNQVSINISKLYWPEEAHSNSARDDHSVPTDHRSIYPFILAHPSFALCKVISFFFYLKQH